MKTPDKTDSLSFSNPSVAPGWGIILAYLVSSTVAGSMITIIVFGSDFSRASTSGFVGAALLFFLIASLFSLVLASIPFVLLRLILFSCQLSNMMSFGFAGAFAGGITGAVFLSGFEMPWEVVPAGAVAGIAQWVLENRFVGKILVKVDKLPDDE